MTAVPVHPAAARSWQPLVDRIAATTDPRHRANLEVVARHVEAEVAGDLDALMATLVDEPIYRILGASSSQAPVGAAEVRAYYEASVAIGKNRLEFAVDRTVVDDDVVVTEGTFRHAYPGHVLLARGSDEQLEPDGWYLIAYRALVVWPVAADGRLLGEDVYVAEPARVVRRLEEGEMPHLGPVDRAGAVADDVAGAT